MGFISNTYIYLYIDIICIYVCRLRAADHMHGLVTSVAESSRVLGYGCHCQVTATHCNTLQHTSTCCNTLQDAATHDITWSPVLPNQVVCSAMDAAVR